MGFYNVIGRYRWEEIDGEIGHRTKGMLSGPLPPTARVSTI